MRNSFGMSKTSLREMENLNGVRSDRYSTIYLQFQVYINWFKKPSSVLFWLGNQLDYGGQLLAMKGAKCKISPILEGIRSAR